MEPGDSVALEMTNVRTAADRMLAGRYGFMP